MTAQATYQIFVRDNTNNLTAMIEHFEVLTYIKRFNNYGSFSIQLNATDPAVNLLVTANYGIRIERTFAGATDVFTGQVKMIEYQGVLKNTVIISGFDDNFWYTGRCAFPVYTLPYVSTVLADAPVRFYSFGDTGSTAVDLSASAQNGTYNGTVTQQQSQIADDAALSVLLGSNGYISMPIGGMFTGNSAFTMEVWFYYTGAPAITAVLAFAGIPTTASCVYMGILTTGKPTMQLNGTNYSSTTALTIGPHVMQVGYNSTTAYMYVDNVNVANGTPGTCTVGYGSATFGCMGLGLSNFAQCRVHYGAFYNSALNVTKINNHTGVGNTRFSVSATDTQNGPVETLLKHYADFNGGPSAILERTIPNMTIETNSARGSTISWSARFEQLLLLNGSGLLQMLARMGTSELGFSVVQLANQTNLQFQVYMPTDRSTTAIFSVGLGNLADYTYISDSSSIINYVVSGGGGVGIGRYYQVGQDKPSVLNNGRFEGFVDQRSATTPVQLAQAISNALAQSRSKPTFNAAVIDTSAVAYGRDYFLGDKVSVIVNGQQVVNDLVREVQIQLTGAGGEIVTPAVGTPTNGQIISAFGLFIHPINQIAARIAQLERST